MPADFDKCVSSGGRVRTVTGPDKDHGLGADEYVNYCYDKTGSHRGEVKKKEKRGSHKPDTFRGSVTDLSGMQDLDGKRTSTIEFLKIGNWSHPLWGEIDITAERLERFKQNFESGIRKGIAIDVEHKSDDGAVGWVTGLIIDGDCLMAEVEWTDEGVSLIKGRKYRFFSPEYADVYSDPETGAEYRDVLIGGALTNRPFMQKLEEIVLSEKFLDTRKGGETSMEKEKCKECGKMVEKDKMAEHTKEAHKKASLTRDELKAKVLENPGYVPTEEEGVAEELLKEVQAEVEAEKGAAGEGGGEGDAGQEGGKKTAKEPKGKTVQLSENQFKALEDAANAGKQALKELRETQMRETVKGFTYSEGNLDGVILPRMTEMVTGFMITLGEKQRQTFTEILKALPKVRVFGEIGGEGRSDEEPITDDSWAELNRRALKLMGEKPGVYKTYSEAAFEIEKQMKAEGVDFSKV